MARQWYVVHTFTGHEDKVKASIERRAKSEGYGDSVGRVLIPTEEEIRGSKRGRRQVTKHKIYPGYVFVEMELSDRIIVVRTSRRTVALWVDNVLTVIERSAEAIVAASSLMPNMEKVRGVTKMDDDLLLVHRPDDFFSFTWEDNAEPALPDR